MALKGAIEGGGEQMHGFGLAGIGVGVGQKAAGVLGQISPTGN
jgi:hypothetical protein